MTTKASNKNHEPKFTRYLAPLPKKGADVDPVPEPVPCKVAVDIATVPLLLSPLVDPLVVEAFPFTPHAS